ncbi:hypothetical protein Ptr902_10262 [Pyrenophora tritici-repentis]|nr:hypothetical protein Ptr902_10262 [Pyrenophora tritici-repentis]
MTAKLCCTAEQEGRSDSPELPNARISQATPAKRPLLPKDSSSPNSHSTSARSEDLHELREIFHNAGDADDDRAMPMPAGRARFSRPSMQSIRSLHKMTSMRSIIRRKFSKDPSNTAPILTEDKYDVQDTTTISKSGTVVKQSQHGPLQPLHVTKGALKKDLLSDRKPDQGGYDSDAEVLDDIARNISKKLPTKRPSIHSIDWTTSTGRWVDFTSSLPLLMHHSKTHASRQQKTASAPTTKTTFILMISLSRRQCPSRLASTMSLARPTYGQTHRRKGIEGYDAHTLLHQWACQSPPISPLRLPSLTGNDSTGIPWSEAMRESLRLSQFPVPPRHISPKVSKTLLKDDKQPKNSHTDRQPQDITNCVSSTQTLETIPTFPSHVVEIRVQQPTSNASPRPSTSIRGTLREHMPLKKHDQAEQAVDEDVDSNQRHSVHLYSMRISHHLRSGSLLSWDQLADAPQLPTPPRALRERTVSDQSRVSQRNRQSARHNRQTSSSGFASSKVPARWGKVVADNADTHPM